MASFRQQLERVYHSANPAALRQAYHEWARSYDGDLSAAGYAYFNLGPALIARHVPDQASRLLDAGAGTGRIGYFLSLLGYRNLTGIDLSDDMLAMARATGAYATLRQMDLGERLDFPDGTFDATYTFGAFTTGHAPPRGYRELVRVTRAGGPLILVLTDTARTNDGFGAVLDELLQSGALELVTQTPPFAVFPYDPDEYELRARADVYRVC